MNLKKINFSLFYASISLSVLAHGNTSRESKSPNIVMFVADDLGATDISPYGNRIVKTPYLDQLASQSAIFTEAFASSPTCSPSRASLHTGQYPFNNGAHANHTGIKAGVKTLPAYLQELGYKVGFAGKYHIGPMAQYAFDMIHGTNVPEPGHEKHGVLWTDLEMGPVDKWLANASKETKPFVLVVNDHSPHVIWPENPSYQPDEVDIPDIHIDTKETRLARARYYTDITKMDGNVGKLLSSLKKYELEENTIVIFTADQGPQWAFGKWNLYDYGIQVPLIVKWPGITSSEVAIKELVSLTDILPTIIEMAGGNLKDIEHSFDGKSFISLLQGKNKSIHEYIYASHTGDGNMNMSPMRMLRTKQYKYILNLAPEVIYNTHMNKAKDHDGGRTYWDTWINESYKTEHAASVLWRYHNRPAEELYNIQSDPNERINLADDPELREVVQEFRKELSIVRKQQGDMETGVYQEPVNKKKNVTPYIFK